MQHPDEGTIHAWLDGQLPADEAARLDEHVASCAECAAKVAEARGFIAASSRIVTALDHLPRGVIPIRTSKPRRPFRITTMITAIAATAVLAAGTLIVQKRQTSNPQTSASPMATVVLSDSLPPAMPAPMKAAKRPASPTTQTQVAPQPSLGPQPEPHAAEMRKVAATAPKAAPLPRQSRPQLREGQSRLSEVVVTSATGTLPASSAASGAGSSGSFAPTRAAAPPRASAQRAAADMALPTMAGCYEANESTDVLPRRFALDVGGQVRYVDSTSKRDGVIPDVTWADSGGVAVIRNKAGSDLLRIRRQNNELLAEPATGDRRVRLLICAY